MASATVNSPNLTSKPDDGKPIVSTGKKRKNHRGGKKKKPNVNADAVANSGACEIPVTDNYDGDNNADFSKCGDYPEKLYQLQEIPERGYKMFATQDIECGTRILSERPVIQLVIGQESNPYRLMDKVEALPFNERKQFWSLHYFHNTALDPFQIESLRRIREYSPFEDGTYDVSIENIAEITAIYHTNCFYNRRRTRHYLFLEASWIGHSCVPNAHHWVNEHHERLTLHAARDIAQGEEITISYTATINSLADRTEVLASYGVSCVCKACDETSPFGRAFESRRQLQYENDKAMCAALQGDLDPRKVLSIFATEEVGECNLTGAISLRGAHYMFIAAEAYVYSGKPNCGYVFMRRALEVIAKLVGEDNEYWELYKAGADRFADVVKGTEKPLRFTRLLKGSAFFSFIPPRSSGSREDKCDVGTERKLTDGIDKDTGAQTTAS